MLKSIVAMAVVLWSAAVADARPRQAAPHHQTCFIFCFEKSGALDRASYKASVIGGRPVGCPQAFCGCGASIRVFGHIVPSLNLAANWLRFRRAAPAPGMVAASRRHVFVLERHISGSIWLTHDSNSGGHRTRMHPRSIAGFVIVDPHS